MNIKRYAIATIAAFAFVFVFEMLWHGFLMKGMYDATASVWRPESEHHMTFIFVSQFLFAAVLTFIYTAVGHHLSCKRGIAFGFFAGLLLAAVDLGAYCYLPIPLSIVLMWMAASLLKGLGSGIVIALIYK
jgi:hypothetical protein